MIKKKYLSPHSSAFISYFFSLYLPIKRFAFIVFPLFLLLSLPLFSLPNLNFLQNTERYGEGEKTFRRCIRRLRPCFLKKQRVEKK